MHQTRPLPDSHPEFTVFHRPEFTEYRVEHWRLARNGSGRVVHGTCVWSWINVGAVVVVLALFFTQVCGRETETGRLVCPARLPFLDHGIAFPPRAALLGAGIVLTYLIWAQCTQVLYESLLVFPTLGIQLETHRGHPALPNRPLFSSHRFIPLSSLEDVVIHEGFWRWNVRYYLAALYRTGRCTNGTANPVVDAGSGVSSETLGNVQVCVAFENILPYFPVLKEVYLGVQLALFPPPTRVETKKENGS